MSTKESAIQVMAQLLAMLDEKKLKYRGLLGISGQSSPAVSGRPNYVWFREDGNDSKARQILNVKTPSISDLPVIVGQDANNPGFEQVLDVDIGMLPKWLGRSFVPEHHGTHELGAIDAVGNRIDSDVVYVQKAQFVPLSARAQTTPDMTLYIEADYYLYGSVRNFWSGGSTKTFSPPVTDGYAAYELVCIDGATNQLVYVRGVDFPQNAPMDETLIPSAPLGSLPIVAVYLPYGETDLTYENMADTRIFQSTLGGSITGMPHRHTSEFDGGLLSSGLAITGEVLLRRASDDTVMGRWYPELGELHVTGKLAVTGDAIVSGGSIYKSNAIGARVWRTDAQVVNSVAWTPMVFDTELEDVGGCYDSGAPDRFVPPEPGYYTVCGSCAFSAITGGSGICAIGIRKNGSDYLTIQELDLSTSLTRSISAADNMIHLDGITDYIQFVLYQDTGVPVSTVSTTGDVSLQHRFKGSISRNP